MRIESVKVLRKALDLYIEHMQDSEDYSFIYADLDKEVEE